MSRSSTVWSGTQERYVAYCFANCAASPEEMLERDRIAHPGGVMVGYMLWISGMWRVWRDLNKKDENAPVSKAEHKDFSSWLLDFVLTLPRHRQWARGTMRFDAAIAA